MMCGFVKLTYTFDGVLAPLRARQLLSALRYVQEANHTIVHVCVHAHVYHIHIHTHAHTHIFNYLWYCWKFFSTWITEKSSQIAACQRVVVGINYLTL